MNKKIAKLFKSAKGELHGIFYFLDGENPRVSYCRYPFSCLKKQIGLIPEGYVFVTNENMFAVVPRSVDITVACTPKNKEHYTVAVFKFVDRSSVLECEMLRSITSELKLPHYEDKLSELLSTLSMDIFLVHLSPDGVHTERHATRDVSSVSVVDTRICCELKSGKHINLPMQTNQQLVGYEEDSDTCILTGFIPSSLDVDKDYIDFCLEYMRKVKSGEMDSQESTI